MELTKEAKEQFLKDYLDYTEWFCRETEKNGTTASLMDFSRWLVDKVIDENIAESSNG